MSLPCLQRGRCPMQDLISSPNYHDKSASKSQMMMNVLPAMHHYYERMAHLHFGSASLCVVILPLPCVRRNRFHMKELSPFLHRYSYYTAITLQMETRLKQTLLYDSPDTSVTLLAILLDYRHPKWRPWWRIRRQQKEKTRMRRTLRDLTIAEGTKNSSACLESRTRRCWAYLGRSAAPLLRGRRSRYRQVGKSWKSVGQKNL